MIELTNTDGDHILLSTTTWDMILRLASVMEYEVRHSGTFPNLSNNPYLNHGQSLYVKHATNNIRVTCGGNTVTLIEAKWLAGALFGLMPTIPDEQVVGHPLEV